MADADSGSLIDTVERSLLGAVILSEGDRQREGIDLVSAFEPSSWSTASARAVASALVRLRGRAGEISLPTLGAELGVAGEWAKIGGNDYLISLADTPSTTCAPVFAGDLRRLQAKARACSIIRDIHSDLSTGESPNGKLEELAFAIEAMRGQVHEIAIPPSRLAADIIAQELPAIDYGVEPICSTGNLTMIQGEPKSGKSCFALYMAVSMAFGAWCTGRFSCSRPRRVLFLTWEDGLRRIKTRLNQYVSGLGSTASPPDLRIYTHDDAPLLRLENADGRALLVRMIVENRSEVVFLDTLSHLHGVDENSKKEMQPVVDALKNTARDLHVAMVVLHHSGKPSKDAQRSIAYRSRGSSAIAAGADIILDWGDRGSTNITPCKLLSKDDDSDEFAVVYEPQDDGSVRWKIEDADDSSMKAANRDRIQAVIAELTPGYPDGIPQTVIVKTSELAKNTVKIHLFEMQERGLVRWKLSGRSKVWYGVKPTD